MLCFIKTYHSIPSRVFVVLLLSLLIAGIGTSLADTAPNVTPAPEDMQQTEAITTAAEILIAHFDDVEGIFSTASSEAYYGYIDAAYDEPTWMVEFSNPDRFTGTYCVMLSREGDLLYYNAPNAKPYAPGEDELTGTTFATPEVNDISEEQVVAIALDALYEIGDFETRMDQITTEAYFLYGDRYNNGWEPVWLIYFYQDHEPVYKALFGYDGSYIAMASMDAEFQNVLRNGLYIEETIGVNFMSLNFWGMTVEEKADFSNIWNQVIDAYVADRPYYSNQNDLFYQVTRHTYGVPDELDITQDEATALAQNAIIALGADASIVSHQAIEYYFDISDSEHPLWKLVFLLYMDGEKRNNAGSISPYYVVIDARTSAIIEAFQISNEMDILDYRQ